MWSRCAICRAPGLSPCRGCAAGLRPAPELDVPPGLDGCCAVVAYDAAARALLVGLKAANHRAGLGWLADRLAASMPCPAGSVLTWAPTTRTRARARGFDHAELLARAVGRRWRRPVRDLLRRAAGPAQSGQDRRGRHAHPGFTARSRVPGRIVVIDDVSTTGATLSAAAKALRSGGAGQILGLVVARAGSGPEIP